ncbi:MULTISPECIES: hypothetical protein [Nostoc]|uniref:Uncharacterized protein n=1 Tax=Nostoc paludosum FACHB-159 TaxID=2692908 RepID=A0ABR8KM71_9NOSO|nr:MULTISPECIES: hypothetical protein [Nostoc]MBD2683356.1 hypothetical protein [Nostoc sp. FACHB-857]MBD2739674.1 hypothetical protein [Nostoc paludosum FACHB-159]
MAALLVGLVVLLAVEDLVDLVDLVVVLAFGCTTEAAGDSSLTEGNGSTMDWMWIGVD